MTVLQNSLMFPIFLSFVLTGNQLFRVHNCQKTSPNGLEHLHFGKGESHFRKYIFNGEKLSVFLPTLKIHQICMEKSKIYNHKGLGGKARLLKCQLEILTRRVVDLGPKGAFPQILPPLMDF